MAEAAKVDKGVDTRSLASKQWLQFKRAFDNGHAQWTKDADLFDAFYRGEQWAQEDIDKLVKANRPALTINMILPTINAILGQQSNSRVDMVYKARRSKFHENADALTQVALQIQDANRYDWVESEVFQDGLITDRGYFDIRLDFTNDIKGEVRIVSRDPRQVVLDIEAKEYDPRTWKRVFVYSWMTLSDIEEQYGKDKAEELEAIGAMRSSFGRDSMDIGPDENTFGDADASTEGEDLGSTVRSVRIVEQQHKQYTRSRYFVDLATGDMSAVPESWDEEKVKAFSRQFQLGVSMRWGHRIRWTTTADSVVLYDEWSLYDDFTIVPYFPYFRRGKPFGAVRNLVSPQEMLNKISSQELHVVNTTANSGWVYEDGTLVNMDDAELAERGAETGLVLVHARGSNPPQKITPNQVPSGLDRIGMKTQANIRSISGINDGMLGETSPEVSGVVIEQKKGSSLLQTQVPLDNLAKTRHLVAERILRLVQKFYTEERIVRILNDMLPWDVPQDEELVVNQMNPDGTISRDLTVGEYNVVVTTQPNRDTFEDTQFAQAVSLREMGVQIPDHILVEYSHLARKRDLSELLKRLGGFAEPTPEEQEMQAVMQQIQMQQIQTELAKLEAEGEELRARAAVQMQKAESLSAADRDRMLKIESDIALKREEFELRERLARLTQQSRTMEVGSRMMMTSAQLETQQKVASSRNQKQSPTKR